VHQRADSSQALLLAPAALWHHRAVRFGIALPNYGPLATGDNLVQLAERAEEMGAGGVWVSDHLVAPVGARSIYPYDRRPDPRPGDLGVIEQVYEPLVTLAVLAGRTRRVHLGVSAYVMPYRNPVITAKQVATLDALSGGRVILAVGVGWLREEFAALDVPFAARGRRTDDYLAVCRALWAGGTASYEGDTYTLPPVRTGPPPAQRPHQPIWIAGNSPAAIERAARHGDGWHGNDLSPAELRQAASRVRARAGEHGRPADSIEITLRHLVVPGGATGRTLQGDPASIRRDLDAYRDAGLDYLVAGLPRLRTVEQTMRALEAVTSVLTA
jgi:probable F420-dependent oxidoreductase